MNDNLLLLVKINRAFYYTTNFNSNKSYGNQNLNDDTIGFL